jgi:hypothetical protein
MPGKIASRASELAQQVAAHLLPDRDTLRGTRHPQLSEGPGLGHEEGPPLSIIGGDHAGPGGWWLVLEPDVELESHEIVAPDVAGWRRSSMPEFPSERPIRMRPDWVCEVASPSNRWRDRGRKADLYLRFGIPHYWIVDPDERTLEAYAARDGAWVRLGAWTDGDFPRIPPFDAIELDVGGLFPPLP